MREHPNHGQYDSVGRNTDGERRYAACCLGSSVPFGRASVGDDSRTRPEVTRPALVIEARKPDQDWWMSWIDGRITGKVRSLSEVLRIAAQRGCRPSEIHWLGPAYIEMVEAGVAPAGGWDTYDLVD